MQQTHWENMSLAHRALWREYARLADLPHEEFMAAFMRMQLRPDVVPPAIVRLWRSAWPEHRGIAYVCLVVCDGLKGSPAATSPPNRARSNAST